MLAGSPVRILVRHADPLTQIGLSAALQAYDDFEVAHGHAEADVLAVDLDSGMQHLREARRDGRPPYVLVVTTSDREVDIRRALKLGAKGYVLQGGPLDDLARAVREASGGRMHLGAAVAQKLAESLYGAALTMREDEVLRCVVDGCCNKEIAARLGLSVGTVKSHLRAVYAKLEVTSRTHAAAEARRRGLLRSRAHQPMAATA